MNKYSRGHSHIYSKKGAGIHPPLTSVYLISLVEQSIISTEIIELSCRIRRRPKAMAWWAFWKMARDSLSGRVINDWNILKLLSKNLLPKQKHQHSGYDEGRDTATNIKGKYSGGHPSDGRRACD